MDFVFDRSRLPPLRYFNLFRLVVAGLFVVVGADLNLGGDAPQVFFVATIAYLTAVLALGFPDALRRFGLDRLITIQLVIDIAALTVIMWASGGYRSGMPVLMMVYLAGAGLVAEGRMVLFFAAVATLSVLLENAWRHFAAQGAAEFHQVGLACMGFFAIALTARLLARRAKLNESLAEERGEALGREQAINVRIIEDLRDGVIVLGEDGTVRQSNPRASQMLGTQLTPGSLLAAVDVHFSGLAQQGHSVDGSVQRLGPLGKMLRCRTVSAAGSDGGDGDIVIYLTDFEEIQEQVQQIKLAALGRLTASMAHEIRNPLSAVTQAADLLGDEKRAEVQARLVRIINDNARRIERMVRDVLALGRRDEIMPEALVLAPFLATMVEEMSLRGAEERAVFRVDVHPGATIAVDRAHLHQILGNLLRNARHYASGQPGSVRIYTAATDRDQTAVHVVDDGPGIGEEARRHMFEPFFTTDPKGTGLGLYIARELADANGARLEHVGNEPGAHFVLTARSQA
ncbi:sensor histidine kinase [Rhodocyclaceae bacterium SMB388]